MRCLIARLTSCSAVVAAALIAASLTAGAQSETLWSAAREGNLQQIEAALTRGTPVDARADDGATALFYAAQHGRLDVVEFLAARKADVNVVAQISVANRSFKVSALGVAALGWHADVARSLLKHGARRPEYVVRNHNLLPFSEQELDALRDWEVVNTILRTPEVAEVTRAIVERDAAGTYRTHDGRQYEAQLETDSRLRLTAADGTAMRLQLVAGKAFMQAIQPDDKPASPESRRTRTEQDLTMLGRFLQPLGAEERNALLRQFAERGGVWLDFTIGEGRVLGFEIRDGGPGRLGGTPVLFRKTGVRPEVSPLLERELAAARPVVAPMNWPSFRGPGASGVADGQFLPTSWDGEKSVNIRWKAAIPGLGNSSPVIWGNRIFLTTAISSNPNPEFRPGGLRGDNLSTDRTEHLWKLLCLDRETGKLLWDRTAHSGIPRGRRHLKSTFATPTPATDGTRVIAFFGSEGLYSYDLDGNLLWKKDLGMVGHFSYGFASSPIIYRDMVVIQSDTNGDKKQDRPSSFIAAFDVRDGSERWRIARDEDDRASFGTPTVYEASGRAQIIANGGTRARAYDPATGREIWSLAAPSDIVTPSPVVSRDLIFIMSGNTGFQPIFAIRPNAVGDITPKPGEETNDFVAWSSTRGGSFTPTPIVYGDYLYSINVSGIVGCYDARTGERKYLERLLHAGSGFSSSPIAADGRLYFSSEDGDVFVVKAGPEFELLGTNPMGEVIMTTPAVSGGMIFIRTLHHLFGIG